MGAGSGSTPPCPCWVGVGLGWFRWFGGSFMRVGFELV